MIFAIGEVLVDFIAVEDADLKNVRTFEKHPGGAPANMVVGLRRLNVPSGLISKVGRDVLGEFLVEELEREGVDTRYVVYDDEARTGVVFVQLKQTRPSFLLYDRVAYFNLKSEDVDSSFIKEADLLHFGGVLLAREPSRTTSFEVVGRAKNSGLPISFDVNLRLHLWENKIDELIECTREALKLADVVKLGEGEKKFLEEHGVDLGEFGVKLLAITKGEEGSELVHEGKRVVLPAHQVETIDPTGAGDAYMAALLAALYSMGKLRDLSLSNEELRLIGMFANIVAGISTTKRGAWSVPELSSLTKYPDIKTIVERLMRLS